MNVFSFSNYPNRFTQTLKRWGTRSGRTQTVVARVFSPTKPVLEVTDIVTTDIYHFAVQTATATEVDVESIVSSASTELASNISVNEISSVDSEESIEDDAGDPEYDKRTVLVEGKPPQDQIKFIVFKQAILDVFGQCGQCGSKCVNTAENQISSCCKICVACSSDSEHYFEWTTSPCIFKMAAFHLLLGSGILTFCVFFEALKILNVKR